MQIEEAEAKDQLSCRLCSKTYKTAKQLKGHLKSQRHGLEVAKREEVERASATSATILQGSDPEADSDDDGNCSEASQDFDSNICLFCNEEFDSLEHNMLHMFKIHGLFVPDQEHLIDLSSLLGYLSLLITDFNECLYCGKIKGSVEGIQHHMISKAHCKINLDEKSQLEDFYDFPQDRDFQLLEVKDGEKDVHLATGKTLVHRSRAYLFHQRVPTHAPSSTAGQLSLEETASSDTASTLGPEQTQALTATNKALITRKSNSQALIGISDTQRRTLRAVEKKMMSMEIRTRKEYERKVEKIGNKRKFFRASVPGPGLGLSH